MKVEDVEKDLLPYYWVINNFDDLDTAERLYVMMEIAELSKKFRPLYSKYQKNDVHKTLDNIIKDETKKVTRRKNKEDK